MVQQIKLNDGNVIPNLGFGTWQSKPNEVGNAVEAAIKAGYRHLDLAKVYKNQPEIKDGIKRAGVPRSELFITSKLWNNSHKPELVAAALDDTLAEIGTDYLDLYLIHWPVAFVPEGDVTQNLFPLTDDKKQVKLDLETSLVDTWKAMIKLVGPKVKSIGVSNFSKEAIEILIKETGVTPAVNQIERHPLLAQPELIEYHKQKGIHITAYSPLGNNNEGLKKLFEYPEVIKIAEKLNVTPAQVLIAWGLKGGHSVIPKSVTASRIASNFEEIELPDEDFKEITKLGEGDKKFRFNVAWNYSPQWPIDVFGEKAEQEAPNKVKAI